MVTHIFSDIIKISKKKTLRILTVFIDTIRANRLSIIENDLKRNPFDKYLENLGGTVYTNVISPGPDTPRGSSVYFSGKPPWENGCNTRCKWPRFFLDKNSYTNLDLFSEYDYEQYFFSNPNERNLGLLPSEAERYKNNTDLSLQNFINEIELNNKSHLFVSLPDLSWVLNDFGYNKFSENLGYKKIISSLDIIFKKFPPDYFDNIIFFSDHGFKFSSEINKTKNEKYFLYLFNEDRIRPLLFHRNKKDKNLNINNKLLSLADIQSMYKIFLNKDSKIKNLNERKYICFEDHLDFGTSNFMKTEIFGYVDKKFLYIRSFYKSLTLDRDGNFISNKFSKKIDDILKSETSFGSKFEYFLKLPQHRPIQIPQNIYTNGSRRIIKKFILVKKFRSFIKKILNKILLLLNIIFK